MMKRALALGGLLLMSSTAAAQTVTETGWTALYNFDTAANLTAVTLGADGTVYWGTYDNPTTIRSRTAEGIFRSLHITGTVTGIASLGDYLYFSSDLDSTSNVKRFHPGDVPANYVGDLRPSSTNDDDPAGIALVPESWSGGTWVAPGDLLVPDMGTNDVIFRIRPNGATGTPSELITDQTTYNTLVDVAVGTNRVFFIDRGDPTGEPLFAISGAGATATVTTQTITGGLGGAPVGIVFDRAVGGANGSLLIAVNATGTNDSIVRLTQGANANTWTKTTIGTGFNFDSDATQAMWLSDDGATLVVGQTGNVRVFARCGLSGANDCDHDNKADACDIISDHKADCNGNLTPDSCDVASGGTSTDCNTDGVPDECGTCSAPVELVFAVDSSASMEDEANAICDNLTTVVTQLRNEGVVVSYRILGIGQSANQASADYDCFGDRSTGPGNLTKNPNDSIESLLGTSIPAADIDPAVGASPNLDTFHAGCGTGTSNREDWGRAVSILAAKYPWPSGAIRLVVPVSDEGPYCGSGLDNNDLHAAQNALYAAKRNAVTVSFILASGYSDSGNIPMEQYAVDLANGTNGSVSREAAASGLPDSIGTIVRNACVAQNDCDNSGVPDLCELQNGAQDCNHNGRLDACESGVTCNAAPVANNDTGATNAGVPVTLAAAITANDTDDTAVLPASIDLDPATAGVQKTFTNTSGTFTVTNAGILTYTPAANFFGSAVASTACE